jgi:transcriptional regulator with XRE-family HTH domain
MPKSLRTPRQQRLQSLLAEIRKARKLTQSDIAERLDRPQSFVAKYEGGERRLDVVEFVEVAEALETDPCALLSTLLHANEPLPPPVQTRRPKRA